MTLRSFAANSGNRHNVLGDDGRRVIFFDPYDLVDACVNLIETSHCIFAFTGACFGVAG